MIKDNDDDIFGDTTAYWAAFPDGISKAYQNFVVTVLQPQINVPPKYLTSLFETAIWPFIIAAYSIPDVGTSLKNKNKPGPYKKELDAIHNTFVSHRNAYYVDGKWTWDYSFEFSWQAATTQKRNLNALIKRQAQGCPAPIFSIDQPSSNATLADSPSTGLFSPMSSSTDAPSGSADVVFCTFVSTLSPPSLQSTAGTGPQRFCQCRAEIEGLIVAASGSVSTTYCKHPARCRRALPWFLLPARHL